MTNMFKFLSPIGMLASALNSKNAAAAPAAPASPAAATIAATPNAVAPKPGTAEEVDRMTEAERRKQTAGGAKTSTSPTTLAGAAGTDKLGG